MLESGNNNFFGESHVVFKKDGGGDEGNSEGGLPTKDEMDFLFDLANKIGKNTDLLSDPDPISRNNKIRGLLGSMGADIHKVVKGIFAFTGIKRDNNEEKKQ